MPNLLRTAELSKSKAPIYLIGMREHIFTGGVSNLASFMGIQVNGERAWKRRERE